MSKTSKSLFQCLLLTVFISLAALGCTSQKEEAKARLGEKFDIRAYHDQVLRNGSLPLIILEKQINAWVASQLDSPS
jgi:hypothetical protein